ncbi:caspase family protein [Aeoliella mucimassa]|uniref:Caspase domain protein n=1 Tax=Aeoliella mucimassa TaxID=2527972 RepID=A0A518AWN2_9BACT|nr:caspase family protein [Aeoliella mucimassa]QDU59116.1 Caspase domain protein [Aeoliella mucimassa]
MGIDWLGRRARTVTFDEYGQSDVSPSAVPSLSTWEPPVGWTDPFYHNKWDYTSSVSQAYNSFGGESPPDVRPYLEWASRQSTHDPTSITPINGLRVGSTASYFPRLNMRSLDIAPPVLSNYRSYPEPLTATIRGWREDKTKDPSSPERWNELQTKTVSLQLPNITQVETENGLRPRYESQYTHVNLSGWNQLDRVTFEVNDPNGGTVDNVWVDNIKANAGTTHGFFLGAPDITAIDAGRDTSAMVKAMQDAFGMQSYSRYVLPNIYNNMQSTAEVSEQVFARLDNVKQYLQPGDNFVFYYSGHGVQRTGTSSEPNGDEALVLSRNALLSDDALTEYFTRDPIWAQVDKVFMLDACHSGGFWTSREDAIALNGHEDGSTGPTDLATLPRTALLAAAPEYQTALSFAKLSQVEETQLPGTENFKT